MSEKIYRIAGVCLGFPCEERVAEKGRKETSSAYGTEKENMTKVNGASGTGTVGYDLGEKKSGSTKNLFI